MASKFSALGELTAMRRRGQRPDYPVVIGDNREAQDWALKNGFFYVRREDIADDLSAFAGLYVWFRTAKPFAQVREFAQALAFEARMVTIVDSHKREWAEFVVAA
jgi:predicted MPP superfamily phosphohydrolase